MSIQGVPSGGGLETKPSCGSRIHLEDTAKDGIKLTCSIDPRSIDLSLWEAELGHNSGRD